MYPSREELEIEYFLRYDYRREAREGSGEVDVPNDFYPSDEEMTAAGWSLNEDGVWVHPDYPAPPKPEAPDPDIPF